MNDSELRCLFLFFYSCTYVLIRRWINGWDVAFSLGFSSFAQTVITQSSVISHMAASRRALRLCALKGRSVVIQEQALIDCTHWPESGLKTLSGFRADAANTFKQFLSFLSGRSICVPGEVMLTLTSHSSSDFSGKGSVKTFMWLWGTVVG